MASNGKITRDALREAMLSSRPAVEVVPLKSGLSVEVRQPTVGEQLELAKSEDTGDRVLRLFIEHVYVPGTNERVFDEADYEVLKQLPAAGDYQSIMKALTVLMDITAAVEAATKNSGATLSSAPSTT